jgi:hypothetical protein
MKRRDRPPGGRANRLRASAKLDVHPSSGTGQPLNDVGQGQEGDRAGTAAIGAKRPPGIGEFRSLELDLLGDV